MASEAAFRGATWSQGIAFGSPVVPLLKRTFVTSWGWQATVSKSLDELRDKNFM